ncbi:helix-turn-helix domain-containing protein [Oceanospirillum sediminis]|uniref:AraC family transcriptional regulator n=1 Tax=Oceanospirillum sediminis TaxID=2760088 RepID=A0A839INE5_9GAMM|nr:AraC family transcriptional regulator [Oceanospirillum sediminis]MBB1486220.1 AraC family transcriptional regulator [Oceanospirillum sediminis]
MASFSDNPPLQPDYADLANTTGHINRDIPWHIDSQLPDILRNIAAQIKASSVDEINLEKLALTYETTSEELTRLFMDYLGLSPEEYHEKARLNHAQYLLEETLCSLKQVADETGFKNIQSLQAAFLDKVGMYPSRYR